MPDSTIGRSVMAPSPAIADPGAIVARPPAIPGAEPEQHLTEASWLEARRRGIGGSDAAALMGVATHVSALGLYLEKTGEVDVKDHLAGVEWAYWGKKLEWPTLEWYAERSGHRLVRPGRFTIYRSREHPFASATFDALVLDDPRGPGVIQAKTASAWIADRWAKDPPLEFAVQVAHEMLVAGARWAVIPVLIGGQRADAFELERDDEFIAVLLEREREFWRRVEQRDPPPESDPHAMREALRRRFPKHEPGLTVKLDERAVEWDQKREEAEAQIEQWKAVKLDSENKLREEIGEAEFGILPDGTTYRSRLIQRCSYTVPASEYRELRRLESGAAGRG